ncbi:MAG: hypothetical protein ACTSPY_13500 [Candidatus Helarchaeota archaeon]
MSTEALEKEIEKLKSDLEFKSKRIEKLELEIAKNKTESRLKDEKIEKQKNEIDQRIKELEIKEDQIKSLKEKIESLATEQLEMELNNLKELTKKQENEISTLKSEKESISNELNGSKKLIDELNTKLTSLQEDFAKYKKKFSDAENEINNKEKELIKLNIQNAKLEESVKSLKNLLDASNNEKNQVYENIEQLNNKITKLEKQIKEKDAKLEEIQKEFNLITQVSDNNKNLVDEYKSQIVELNNKLSNYINESDEKDIKINKLQEELDKLHVGVDLYEDNIKELKDELKEKEIEIEKLKSITKDKDKDKEKEYKVNELNRRIKLLEMELDETKKELEKEKTKKKKGIEKEIDVQDIEEGLEFDLEKILIGKLTDSDKESLRDQFKKQQSLIKTFRTVSNKQKSQIEKLENKLNKRESELDELKSKTKDLEKETKKLNKELKKKTYVIKELESEVDLEDAIDKVDKVGEYESVYEEINRLKTLLEKAHGTIESQKETIKGLETTVAALRQDSNVQTAQQLRESYEQYIMNLQKEAYDNKYQLESALKEIDELRYQLERYNKLFAQYESHIERIESIGQDLEPEVPISQYSSPSEEYPPVNQEVAYEDQEQNAPGFVPSETNLRPSELFKTIPYQGKTESTKVPRSNGSSELISGELSSSPEISDPGLSKSPNKISSGDGLLTSDDLLGTSKSSGSELLGSSNDGLLAATPEIKLLTEEGKFTLLNKVINKFVKTTNKVQDVALCMFDGLVLSQTFDWDISADIKRVINEWEEEAASIFLKGTKYATLKAGKDVLVATSTQGKGHLLCISVNDDLFIIFVLDKTADPLTIYDDFEPYNSQLKGLL